MKTPKPKLDEKALRLGAAIANHDSAMDLLDLVGWSLAVQSAIARGEQPPNGPPSSVSSHRLARARAKADLEQDRINSDSLPPAITRQLAVELETVVNTIHNLAASYLAQAEQATSPPAPPRRRVRFSRNRLEARLLGVEYRQPSKRGRKPPMGLSISDETLLKVAAARGDASETAAFDAYAKELLTEMGKHAAGERYKRLSMYMRRRLGDLKKDRSEYKPKTALR